MTERDRENDAARVGTALREERIKNPYRVWKLDPPHDTYGNLRYDLWEDKRKARNA
jgi:hypothetical protein